MKRMGFFIVLALLVVLTLQTTAQAARVIGVWTRVAEGIQYATGSDDSPRLMKAFALKIDLQDPAVQMYASHDNGAAAYEVAVQTTPAFLTEHGLTAAVNACFFNASLSPNTNIEGLLVSNGSVVSTWEAYRDAEMRFTVNKVASIVNNGGTSGVYVGAAGAEYNLINGTCLGDNGTPEPRTSGGITQDGRYVIFVVVDGRQSGWSLGATILDMAYWLQNFGAYNGMCFDGGGSSTMTIAGAGSYVNRPCYGYARSVGASIGASTVPTAGLSACAMNANRVDVVERGPFGNIRMKTWTPSGWGAWVNLGGVTNDTPAIVSRMDGTLDLFCRGTDNCLWHGNFLNGVWSGWVDNLGGVLWSAPSACSKDANHLDVVVRGNDSSVYLKSWNSTTGWGAWTGLGGTTYDAPGIGSHTSTCMNVYYRGTNNHLYTKYNCGGGWIGWTDLGGNITSGPVAESLGSNNVMVFARSATGSINEIWWDPSLGWSSWIDLGGGFVGKPGVCCPSSGITDVFVRSGDDLIWEDTWYVATGWSGLYLTGFSY